MEVDDNIFPMNEWMEILPFTYENSNRIDIIVEVYLVWYILVKRCDALDRPTLHNMKEITHVLKPRVKPWKFRVHKG